MILEFRCSNFGSINDEVIFSMQAVDGLPKEETLITLPNYSKKYLRTAQIYGANGSGKTTLLLAIDTMRAIINNCYEKAEEKDFLCQRYKPHKLNQNNQTNFTMMFLPSETENETIYYYSFSYNADRITEEALYYLENEKFIKIFEREGQNITWGDNIDDDGLDIDDCEPSVLMLSLASNPESDITAIKETYQFFQKDIFLFDDKLFYQKTNKIDFDTKAQIINHSDNLSKIIDFMKKFCQGLSAIKVNPGNDRILMVYKDTLNQEFCLDLKDEESSGVQRLFTYAAAITYCINSGKIFIFDELERAMHPEAIKYIIHLFNNNKEKKAQAIFTTHADVSLDQNFIRRDQIWLTNLTSEGRATEIYSLAEMEDISLGDNIREMYLDGRFGGVPYSIVKELIDNNAASTGEINNEVIV